MGAAFGAGCHPDTAVALTRAITEAAQSRLTAIAGSRDDLAPLDYGRRQSQDASEHHRRLLATSPAWAWPPRCGSVATPTIDGDLAAVVAQLRRTGLHEVVTVDLSRPGTGIHVVRVIVPGLEGPTQSTVYRPGPRGAGPGGWMTVDQMTVDG